MGRLDEFQASIGGRLRSTTVTCGEEEKDKSQDGGSINHWSHCDICYWSPINYYSAVSHHPANTQLSPHVIFPNINITRVYQEFCYFRIHVYYGASSINLRINNGFFQGCKVSLHWMRKATHVCIYTRAREFRPQFAVLSREPLQ